MVLNIITGNHFPQRKIFIGTNRFFGSHRLSGLITSKDSNYVIKINKKSVKIVTSDRCRNEDFNKIRLYIETLFKNSSILVVASEDTYLLQDIQNVTINTLPKENDKVVRI